MFVFSLVLTLCAGAAGNVGDKCDDYVLDTFKTQTECIYHMDDRIKGAKRLFKNADNWIVSCEVKKK